VSAAGGEAQRIFLAATGQNRGKTTASLGLIAGVVRRGHRLGFLKPVGQRYLVVDGQRADEDAVLMKAAFDLPDTLDDMSPVTLPRHFTTDYIMGRITDDLSARVAAAYRRLAAGKELVIIEGTGHAGVGAVIGLSNADVAALLDAPVVIVSGGGVGRPIDEIVLNAALFRDRGVRILGAIVNKVYAADRPELPEVLRRGLAPHGIELLGCIPYSTFLANPSLELLVTHLEGEQLAGEASAGSVIGRVAIGAMEARHAIPLLSERTLLITPGDREDLQRAAVVANREADKGRPTVIGLVLTGGFRPSPATLATLRQAGLFTYLVEGDTYAAAQAVDELLVKTHPADTEKIATIIALVARSIDLDALLERL
jgi:BioD-like phosphotransacetylase family protein